MTRATVDEAKVEAATPEALPAGKYKALPAGNGLTTAQVIAAARERGWSAAGNGDGLVLCTSKRSDTWELWRIAEAVGGTATTLFTQSGLRVRVADTSRAPHVFVVARGLFAKDALAELFYRPYRGLDTLRRALKAAANPGVTGSATPAKKKRKPLARVAASDGAEPQAVVAAETPDRNSREAHQ